MNNLRPLSTLRSLTTRITPPRVVGGWWYRLFRLSLPRSLSSHDDATLTKITPRDSAFSDLSFTFAVIALSAQVACADGRLSRAKYLAFRDAFPLTGGICGKIRKLFALACQNQTPSEHYITQIKHSFPRKQELFGALVDRLFSIACADGGIGRDSERLLAKIAHGLDIAAGDYSRMRDHHLAPKAHVVLGLPKRPTGRELKKRYHALMRRYHPDRFACETLSPEVELLLTLKTSEINHAYRTLAKRVA